MARPAMIAAVLLLLAAAGGWWWQNRAPPPVQWQGYAEAGISVKVGPEPSRAPHHVCGPARLEGHLSGAALFDQDDTADQAAKEQVARRCSGRPRSNSPISRPAAS